MYTEIHFVMSHFNQDTQQSIVVCQNAENCNVCSRYPRAGLTIVQLKMY